MTTLTGLPPWSGWVKANMHSEPCRGRLARASEDGPAAAEPCMQLSSTTLWILPVSKVTPGAAEYGLAREIPSLDPDGHSMAMPARVSSVSGTSMAASMRFAFRRAAIASAVGSE